MELRILFKHETPTRVSRTSFLVQGKGEWWRKAVTVRGLRKRVYHYHGLAVGEGVISYH